MVEKRKGTGSPKSIRDRMLKEQSCNFFFCLTSIRWFLLHNFNESFVCENLSLFLIRSWGKGVAQREWKFDLGEGYGTTNSDWCFISGAVIDVIILKSWRSIIKPYLWLDPSLINLTVNKNWFLNDLFWTISLFWA